MTKEHTVYIHIYKAHINKHHKTAMHVFDLTFLDKFHMLTMAGLKTLYKQGGSRQDDLCFEWQQPVKHNKDQIKKSREWCFSVPHTVRNRLSCRWMIFSENVTNAKFAVTEINM